jgi:hypothetical protein
MAIFLSTAYSECTLGKTRLTRKDGRVLEWDNCFEEGDKYCTQKPYGKACLLKNNFTSVEPYKDVSDDADVIIYNSRTPIEQNEIDRMAAEEAKRKARDSDRTSWEKQKAIENTTSTKDSPQEKPKVEEELNCYSFRVGDYTYEHCKDKSGKIVRKRKI